MCLVPPARLSQVWRKVFLVRKASAPAHFKLLDEKRELIDEPEDGCPKGVISDADTDHNVFNEWGMYYKSPPNSGQPRNPFEMARARAPTVAAPPPAAAEATAAEAVEVEAEAAETPEVTMAEAEVAPAEAAEAEAVPAEVTMAEAAPAETAPAPAPEVTMAEAAPAETAPAPAPALAPAAPAPAPAPAPARKALAAFADML